MTELILLQNNNEAIKIASRSGRVERVELVELLLWDPRVDPSAENNASIREASERLNVVMWE